ncbi:MAG: hypothetical protein HY812_06480 [Planctomycetes bacterium]|nr:hypothetical protein [Planctomycetota bacterium]
MPEAQDAASTSGGDLPAAACFAAGSAFLALGLADILAGRFGFPGTALAPDVAGLLSRAGGDKGCEIGLFYYALLLVPALAGAGFLAARAAACRGAGILLLGSGILAAGSVWSSFSTGWSGGASARGPVPAAVLAGGLFAAWVLGPRTRERLGRALCALRRLFAGAEGPLACGVSLAVLAAAVGPRVPPDLPLALSGLRVAGVLAGSVFAAFGLALALQGLVSRDCPPARRILDPRVARALRWGVWLLAGRLAPESAVWVGAAIAAAVLGGAGSLVLSARGAGAGAADAGAPRRFLVRRFLPLLVLMLVFHRDVNGLIDFYHAGEWLAPASEAARGEVPYRDIYLQHGLVQNVLRPLASFALLGWTLAADRLAQNFMYAAAHAAFFLLLAAAVRSWLFALLLSLALASEGLLLAPRFLALFLALACALVDLRQARAAGGASLPRRRRWPLVACGACLSLAVFWSLDGGLCGALAIGVFLTLEALGRRTEPARTRLAPFLWLACGAFLGALPFAAYLGACGACGAFWRNCAAQVGLQLSVWGIPFPPLRALLDLVRAQGAIAALGDSRVAALLAAGAFIGVPAAVLILALCRRCTRACYVQLLLALAGASLFRSALGRSDPGHLGYAATLLWPILAVAAESALASRPLRRGPASVAALARVLPAALFAAWLIGAHAPLYGMARHWSRLSEALPGGPGGGYSTIPLPRAGDVLVPDVQARALAALASFLDERTPRGAPVFGFSNMGAIHFFLDRDCPTRFVMPIYAATHAMQRAVIADLERARPRYVISSALLGLDPVDGVPMAERLPLVVEYLAATYRLHSDQGFGVVYERR